MPDAKLTNSTAIPPLTTGQNNDLYYIVQNGVSRSILGSGIANFLNNEHFLKDSVNFRVLSGTFKITGDYDIEVINGTGFFRQIVGGDKLTHQIVKSNTSYSSIIAGANNSLQGTYSAIVGGTGQKVDGNYAVAVAGLGNVAGADYSCVVGGSLNVINQANSFVGGGSENKVSGNYAGVSCGRVNVASGDNSYIGGGAENNARGDSAAILAGSYNRAFGNYAVIVGGSLNQAKGLYSCIGGGTNNVAAEDYTSVTAGTQNIASGSYSTVVGGFRGKTYSDYNFIGAGIRIGVSGIGSCAVGGTGLQVSGDFSCALGGKLISTTGEYTVILGGNANTGHGHYSFLAAGQENYLRSTPFGVLINGQQNKASGNFPVIINGQTHDIQYGTGGFIGNGISNSGNDNYFSIVNGETCYASGRSFIGAGTTNRAGSSYSTVVCGNTNTVRLPYGAILNGASNVSSGTSATVINGLSCESLGNYSTIANGDTNKVIYSTHSFIGAGEDIVISGGGHNVIGGGNLNNIDVSKSYSCIAGGAKNRLQGDYGFLVGQNNTGLGTACVAMGCGNSARGNYSYALGQNCIASGVNTYALGNAAKVYSSHAGSVVWGDSISKQKDSPDAQCMTLFFQSGLRLSGTPLVLDNNPFTGPTDAADTRGTIGQCSLVESEGIWVRTKGYEASDGVYWRLLPFSPVTAGGSAVITADLVDFGTGTAGTYVVTTTSQKVVFDNSVAADITLPEAGTYIVTATIPLRINRMPEGESLVDVWLENATPTNAIIADSQRTIGVESILGSVGSETNDSMTLNLRVQGIIRVKITVDQASVIELWTHVNIAEDDRTNIIYASSCTMDYLKIAT